MTDQEITDYSALTDQERLDVSLRGQSRHVSPIKPRAVAWDLDSTVCRTMHRRHLIPAIRAGEATWDDYSMLAADDEPIQGVVRLMRLLAYNHLNIAISGRSDGALDLTRDWAKRHQVPLDRYELRPAGDRTDNGVFKVQRLRKLTDDGIVVVLFVEDWGPVATYVHAETGIPVLGVNPFDPEPAGASV